MAKSKLEDKFAALWESQAADCAKPEREYRFHPERKWRFDFAFPDSRVAVEMEGGIWTGGGHNRGTIYNTNCDKYNAAAMLGWTVLRYTTNHLRDRPAEVISEVRGVVEAKAGLWNE